MKNKKIFVFGVALFLFALVVGFAFAQTGGELGNVMWWREGGGSANATTTIYNRNDYAVLIDISSQLLSENRRNYELGSRESKTLPGRLTVVKVVKK